MANPPNIGYTVEVATTSFLNSFTCTTVTVRAGLKTKVCSASVHLHACAIASNTRHPHPHIRTIVARCSYVSVIFNATTPHHFRPLDTISWCRVSVPVSDLPEFVQCRGGEHDPNHVMSGGIIHEDKTRWNNWVKTWQKYVDLQESLARLPLASISCIQITIMVTFSVCRPDVCSTIPYSASIHPSLLSSCPSSLTFETKQFLGSKISNSRPICWLKELSSIHNTKLSQWWKKGKERGNTFNFPTNIVDKNLQKGCEAWCWKARSIDSMMEVGMWSLIMKQTTHANSSLPYTLQARGKTHCVRCTC